MTIKSVKAREILDSRGNPTVEVDIITEKGLSRAAVPSGASVGTHEALELRDNDKDRYLGKGVLNAVDNVNNTISPTLIGKNPGEQGRIDDALVMLDGTDNKEKLGANAILGVSMALCKAGAAEKGIPLYKHIASIANVDGFVMPVPFCNIVNGGVHADNELSFQEFMIVPVDFESFKEALRACAEIYHILKDEIHKKYGKGTTNVGDEGGFAPEEFKSVKDPLDLILDSIKKAGYEDKVKIALDCAASEFYKNGKYTVDKKKFTKEKLIEFYKNLVDEYPIISIEDPFDQEDFEAYTELTKEIGRDVQIVGDDSLTTNPERIQKALHRNACNALLLKVNQIGTVTEAIEAAQLAQENGWGVMVSHRSGETEDSFIADLAVGLKTGQIKTGAPCRSERLAKYNQLLRIEEELDSMANYAGANFRRGKE